MQRRPSEIEIERPQLPQPAQSYRVVPQEYELRCGVCGKLSYVDEETADRVNQAITAGGDNPFLCEICEVYDDLS